MMTTVTWRLASVIFAGALLLLLVAPAASRAEPPVLDWDTGAGKSYVIPAAEIAGFLFGLNQVNRHVSNETDYDSEPDTWWKNFRTAPRFDRDPFSVNQLGHPYQGGIYYGLARSSGLNYWESLLYTIGGSWGWETFGEKKPPSANDHIASGIAGTFVGEALFRMASLLLEHGGETPGFWRELGAAVLSPPTGFNDTLCARPLHPYTKALFAAALPSHSDDVQAERTIAGEVPSPLKLPSGCRFHTRCPAAMPVCSEVEPKLQVHDGHQVACHLY